MNLLDILEGNGWSIQQAIQTTFPFDPQFYSSYVRPRLRKRNCELPLVLIDAGRYEREITSSDWREAPIGTDYLLEPVDSRGVFHPKINLFASERSVFYSISSANLTLEEYCKAAQIGYADGFQKSTLLDEDTHIDDSFVLARDVRQFYLNLLEQDGLISGQDARNYITETAETLSWLTDYDETADEPAQTTRFVSNLTQPILPQILERLEELGVRSDLTRVRLYAPYYGTPNVLRKIAERIEPDRLELLVEPESTALDLDGLPDALESFEYEIRKINTSRSTRWIHAKFIVLGGPWGAATLYGSPNMTSTALLEAASSGNVEVGLFTVASTDSEIDLEKEIFDASAFQFEISDPISDPESLELRTTSYEGWESRDRRDRGKIQLEDARLTQPGSDDTSELILTISGLKGEHQLAVTTDEGVKKCVNTTIDEDPHEVSVSISPAERDEWSSAVVTVEAAEASSNPRRVVEEMQAYYREYREIKKSAGTQSSNTLLREILQNPDTAAVSVFDIALSELRKSASRTRESNGDQSETESEEVYPERGPPNITRGGSSLPALHNLVKHHLTYHREQAIDSLDLEDRPQPDDITQFLNHARTFWETIELCFALDQLGQLDTDRINSEKLFENCRSAIDKWFDHMGIVVQRLNGIVDQVETNTAIQEEFLGGHDVDASDLNVWQSVCSVLFLHPGVVLELEQKSDHGVLWSKNGLASRLVTVFKDIHPYIGQHILNGYTLVDQVETLLDNLTVELGGSEDEIVLVGTGIQVLILYILIQRFASPELFFEGATPHPEASEDTVAEVARYVLQEDETIVDYGLVSSVQWSIPLAEPRKKIEALT